MQGSTNDRLRLKSIAQWLRSARERPRPTQVSSNWRAFLARRKATGVR